MKWKQTVILTGIFVTHVLPAAAGESPWPMFRHDRSHTGRTPYSGPATPTLKWIFTADDGIASSPTIGQDGTIYIGAGWNFRGVTDSSLYAIQPDGSLKWRLKLNNGIFSSPALGPDGTVYVGSLDRHLYAIEDSITYGKLRWKTHLNHWVYSSPALGSDGTIYVGSIDFHVYALHPGGDVKWKYLTDWCVLSSPAIGPGGEIYIGSKDHHLYAFEDSLTYGNVRWQYAAGQFYDGHLVDSSPAISPDGTLYVGTDPYGAHGQNPVPVRSVFFAVKPNGALKWVFHMDDGAESSPALGPDGTIYIGSYDGHLYAIRDEGNEGVLKWKFSTRGWIDGSPTVDGCGVVYVGSRDSTLYAINPDGTLRWSFPTGGEIESSPTIDDKGILYIASFNGNLYALGTGGPDVGVASIDLPEEIEISTSLTPAATVTNYRSDPQSFTVSCRIDSSGHRIYGDTVRVRDLADRTSQQVAFAPRTAGPDPETFYTVTVTTSLSGDENWHNDTLSTQVLTTEVIRGDVNRDGQIDGLDVIHALNILVKRHAPTHLEFRAADCNGSVGSCGGDGIMNILDTVKIVRLLLGLEECP